MPYASFWPCLASKPYLFVGVEITAPKKKIFIDLHGPEAEK
jgi:hypothetical protein